MAEITQLKSGSWLVTWEVNVISERNPNLASTTFTCLNFVYKLTFTQNMSLIKLKLETGLLSLGTRKGSYPKAINAFLEGQLQEMDEYIPGSWGPAQWPTYSIPTFKYLSHSTIRSFQLLIEFPSPSSETAFAKGQINVLQNLNKLFEQRCTADVTFIVHGKEIKAHTILLTSASPVFAAMFEHQNFKESHTKTVEIDDIEPVIFEEMLKYVYTGKTHKLDSQCLFQAADKYQINALKEDCEAELIKRLLMESDFTHLMSIVSRKKSGLPESVSLTEEILSILLLAHLHSAPKLLAVSLQILTNLKQDVWAHPKWKGIAKNYPDLFFLAAQHLSEHCHNCSV